MSTTKLSGVKPPPALVLSSNKCENWKLWKQQWNNYVILSKLDKMEATVQLAMLENCLGSDGLKICNSLTFGTDETKDMKAVIMKLEETFIGELNETYERYMFNLRKQQSGESIDDYVTDLRNLAKSCKFCDCLGESLLRDRIVMGVRDLETRKKLLEIKNLKLSACIDLCRSIEATNTQLASVSDMKEVHKIKTKFSGKTDYKNGKADFTCHFCCKKHKMQKSLCPAWGQTCSKCKQKNHFAASAKCPSKNIHKLDVIEMESDSDMALVHVVKNNNSPSTLFGTIVVNNQQIKAQIDTGAAVNVLPAKYVSSGDIKQTETVLQMYNNSTFKPLGESRVTVYNPANGHTYKIKFIIVPDCAGMIPVLGLKACKFMEIVTINDNNLQPVMSVKTCSITDDYADVFDNKLGKLPGKAHFQVNPDICPVVSPVRRIPISLKAKVKVELDNLTDQNVITPIQDPTDWVSNLVVTMKKNGDLRVCLDPQCLNKALKREHFRLPVLDDILPELSNAKLFSTLDVKNAYWHVVLDDESSKLTTFSTPFGRYRWLRMPFGCNVSSEIFQTRLQQSLDGLDGVYCVADDIMITGNGSTEEEAKLDHDVKLKCLLERCRTVGIRLNRDKMKLHQTSVTFLGHLVTAEGLKPDPEKVRAIDDMTRPTDVEGVQRINGFVNYLAKFLPKLSDVTEPIRQLTRKDVPWNWSESQENAFQEMKSLVKKAPVLANFDNEKTVHIQCDASERGLGAALLQNGKPVSFASRALTDTETRYAQIEKELLAIVFSCEKFDHFTFGRTVHVQSDHKPLESILNKPLYRAPKRLQAMIMRLQRYDLIISYVSGKLLYLADTLSRAFSPDGNTVSAQSNLERVCMIQSLPMTEHRILEIKKATESDDEMKLLKSIIINGWPGDKLQLPPEVLPYFSIRDELSVQDGIIFRGERAVIPAELRNVLKEKIHSSHLGIEGCLRRAREAIYWPNMNADMKDYISKCSVCRSTSDCQQKETMMPHDIPDRPWAKVGVDLFSLNNRDYLITVDYYSNFWEVDNLSSTESISVIRKLKAHFARYGIPDVVMSDNGPQFSSERFAKFAETWEFQHDTSSPGHSQSNGKAESAVKTAKKLMKRAELSKSEIYLSFLDHRNTPNDSGYSPAQCLMNRRTKTLLPVTSNLLKPEISVNRHRSLCVSQQRQKSYYDKHSKDLRSLEEGDVVRMKPIHGQQWKKATVCKRLADRSYRVETSDGGTYTRNRVHLRKTTEQPTSSAGSTHLDQPISVVPTIESSHGSNDPPTSQTSATEESAAQERYVTRSGRVVKPVERYE